MATDEVECFRCDTHFQEIIRFLHSRMDLCDVVLVVGRSEKRIATHRLVLLGFSGYFSDFLSEPTLMSQQREVILSDVDEAAIENIINYCYTGKLELRRDTIEALLRTAKQLRLGKIVKGCCEFLQRHLHATNCLGVAFLADQLNLAALLQTTRKFICNNFQAVSGQAEFLLLNAKQLSKFVTTDDLDVPSEEFVFEVIKKWIEYEPETRRIHFAKLLPQMKLSLLSPVFLVDKVAPLCDTMESKDVILNALKPHLNLATECTKPRKKAVKHLLTVYTKNTRKEKENLVFAAYKPDTKVWTTFNTPIKCREEFSVARMDDNLITMGGVSNGSDLNTVTSIDLRTMTAREMAPLGTGRSGHAAAVLNGSIYVIGGYDGNQVLNSVERWDAKSGKWSFVASMKERRFIPGAAVVGGHLYVSGGIANKNLPEGYLISVECYDHVENIWRSKAPMQKARDLHCLAVYKGYLFAIGGRNKECDVPVERYDPQTDTWTTIPCSPNISGYTKCTSDGSDVFIYNNSNIYMISNESNCNRLKLRKMTSDSMESFRKYSTHLALVAISCEVSSVKNWRLHP